MHSQQPAQEPGQPFKLLLEFVPEQEEERDPAFIHAIGRETVEALQEDDIAVRPVYTGQQGGEFLVEFVTTVGQLASSAWDHRTVIEEILNDGSALVTLAGFLGLIIDKVKHIYEKRVGHEESVARPISLTIELDGASVTIESLDAHQAQNILTKLVQQSQQVRANTRTPSSNTLKIQPRIPRKRKGRRR